jgi:hypothetical protein
VGVLAECRVVLTPPTGRAQVLKVALDAQKGPRVLSHIVKRSLPGGRYTWSLLCQRPDGASVIGNTTAGRWSFVVPDGSMPKSAPRPEPKPAPIAKAQAWRCSATVNGCEQIGRLREGISQLEALHARVYEQWGILLGTLFGQLAAPQRAPAVNVIIHSNGITRLRDPNGAYPLEVLLMVQRPGAALLKDPEAVLAAAEALADLERRFKKERDDIVGRLGVQPKLSSAAEAIMARRAIQLKIGKQRVSFSAPTTLLEPLTMLLPQSDHHVSLALVASTPEDPRERLDELLIPLGRAVRHRMAGDRLILDGTARGPEQIAHGFTVPAAHSCEQLRVEARVTRTPEQVRRTWRLSPIAQIKKRRNSP